MYKYQIVLNAIRSSERRLEYLLSKNVDLREITKEVKHLSKLKQDLSIMRDRM